MRFYLDQTTASAFRRCFMRPMVQRKFPKTYTPLLRQAWKDGPGCYLDGSVCEEHPSFARWLGRKLRMAGRNHTFADAFNDLSNRLEALLRRGVVDRLGDLVRDEEPSAKIADTSESPRQKALRKNKVDPDEEAAEEVRLAIEHALGSIEAALEDLVP